MATTTWSLTLLTLVMVVHTKRLETIHDAELEKLIKTEQHVVVLFGKPSCVACTELEHELGMARQYLVEAVGAWVVRAQDGSKITSRHSLREGDLPSILYFRGGVPLLYSGDYKEDISSLILSNTEVNVRHLDDESFEHLTQAATGATTGDWLVLFHQADCPNKSSQLLATMEGVGSLTKSKMNTAMVDISKARSTGERFGVEGTPTLLLLRHGHYYTYELEIYKVKDIVAFVEGGWRNGRGRAVPVGASPFDRLTEEIATYLQRNPALLKFGAIAVSVLVLLSGVVRWRGTSGVGKKKGD